MKKLWTLLFLLSFSVAANAQLNLNMLLGDWDIVSFMEKGEPRNTQNVYYRIGFYGMEEFTVDGNEAGEYIIDQVHLENGREKCFCSGLVLMWEETGELEIDFMVSCSDEDPDSQSEVVSACEYWIGSELKYSVKLDKQLLSLQNLDRTIVLKRR